jgi:hypothetical protein
LVLPRKLRRVLRTCKVCALCRIRRHVYGNENISGSKLDGARNI